MIRYTRPYQWRFDRASNDWDLVDLHHALIAWIRPNLCARVVGTSHLDEQGRRGYELGPYKNIEEAMAAVTAMVMLDVEG